MLWSGEVGLVLLDYSFPKSAENGDFRRIGSASLHGQLRLAENKARKRCAPRRNALVSEAKINLRA